MALVKTIAKSKTLPFNIYCPSAVEMVLIFSGLNSGEEYQRFCYPSREDESSGAEWEELTVDSAGNFTGMLSEEATQTASDDLLVVEIKAWDSSGNNEIKRGRILPLVDTKVKDILPVTSF